MKTPKMVLAVAITTMAVVFGACSGGASPTPAPSGSSPAASASAGASSSPFPSAAEVTGDLVVWDWHYQLETTGAALKKIDEEFIKLHPGVKIEHVGQPADKIDEIYRAAGAAKSGPDVMEVYPGEQGSVQYGRLGLINDLRPLLDQTTLDQFTKGDLDTVSEALDSSKKIFALPWAVQGQPWYYNKKQFAAAGLDANKPPMTYDDFVAACQKLKDAGTVCIASGGAQVNVTGIWMFTNLWTLEATPEYAQKLVTGEIKWTTDPTIRTTVERVYNLVKKGFMRDDFMSVPYMLDGANDFGNGKGATAIGLIADAANYTKYIPMIGEENLGWMQPPGAKWIMSGPATGWSVTSWATNPAAAIEYVKFVSGPEGQKINWELGGNPPTNKSVDISSTAPAILVDMLSAIKKGPSANFLASTWKSGGQEELGRLTQLLFGGTGTVDDVLAGMQAYWDKP